MRSRPPAEIYGAQLTGGASTARQLRQLGDVRRDPPRLVLGKP
jgi:hypothetical protein